MELKESLKDLVFSKSELKRNVYDATKETFEIFRSTTRDLIALFREQCHKEGKDVAFEFTDRGDFEFEVKFAGDILLFMMHTNVFEFHEVTLHSRGHDTLLLRSDTHL